MSLKIDFAGLKTNTHRVLRIKSRFKSMGFKSPHFLFDEFFPEYQSASEQKLIQRVWDLNLDIPEIVQRLEKVFQNLETE